MGAGDERHRSLTFRIGGPLIDARREVAGDGIEQFATGCEFVLPSGNEVLETTGKGMRFRIAADFHDVRTSARVFRLRVKRHG